MTGSRTGSCFSAVRRRRQVLGKGRRRLASVLAVVIASSVAHVPPAGADEAPVTISYENPESTYFHAGTWFIANLGGYDVDPSEKDGNGFISRIGPDEVVSTRWVEGLDSPKGMRAHKGLLWVTDIDRLVAIDIASGKVKQTIALKGATFLNDVDVDVATGHLYVTDTLTDRIWRVAGKKASVFLSSPKLESPNGIVVGDGGIYIGSFGPNPNPQTFMTDQPGHLLHVPFDSKAIHVMSARIGNIDGVERDGKDILVSDFWGGQILRVRPDKTTEVVMRVAPSAADIGWDPKRRVIGVPQMVLNVVEFFEL